jgi:hypothetical protein
MKHTKGNWKKAIHNNAIFTNQNDCLEPICNLVGEHQTEANAKLIAAAPELLMAVKAMYVEFYNSTSNEFEKFSTQKAALKIAELAVKKATE